MTVRWSPPEDDGGTDIIAYIIEKREGNRRMWQNVGTVGPDVLELEAIGLFEGNQYVFRISAENAIGVGEPVELTDTNVPKSQLGECVFWCH